METKDEYSLDDYLGYEAQLELFIQEDSEQIVFNDSFIHAVLIVASILKYAKGKNLSQVSMYCGKFSLFRDSSKQKIEALKGRIKPDEDDVDMYKKWKDFTPYEKLLGSLKEFLDENRKLVVIVENDISEIVKEDVWLSLSKYVDQGSLVFKRIGLPLGLNHFVVAGNSYRRENNDEDKTALGCFNDAKTSTSLIKNFQTLSLMSDNCKFCNS